MTKNKIYSLSNTITNVRRDESPTVEIVNFNPEEDRHILINSSEIVFILNGRIEIVSDIYSSFTIEQGQMVFLPPGASLEMNFKVESSILIIRFNPFQKMNTFFSIKELFNLAESKEFTPNAEILNINNLIWTYLHNLQYYMKSGLSSELFFEIKIKELFFLLNGLYTKEQLCFFFKSILNDDALFAYFVLNNWTKVKNVKEMAQLSFYCETGFNKKFKKVFGKTPYVWLNEKRSGRIYYEIITSDKSLKEIAENYDFNTQQQFSNYCLRNFNLTPGKIRKQEWLNNSIENQ